MLHMEDSFIHDFHSRNAVSIIAISSAVISKYLKNIFPMEFRKSNSNHTDNKRSLKDFLQTQS